MEQQQQLARGLLQQQWPQDCPLSAPQPWLPGPPGRRVSAWPRPTALGTRVGQVFWKWRRPAGASTLAGLAGTGPGQWRQITRRALKLQGRILPGLQTGQGRAPRPEASGGPVKPCWAYCSMQAGTRADMVAQPHRPIPTFASRAAMPLYLDHFRLCKCQDRA